MTQPPHAARYALYYAPPEHTAWWTTWSAWIGRCAASGRETAGFVAALLERERLPRVDAATLARLTEDPRRYGFHATLKPPFRLAPHAPLRALEEDLEQWCAVARSVEIPSLRVERLAPGDFLALVPSAPAPCLQAITEDVVRRFDRFRAPPGEAERARRLAQPLSSRQRELLDRWGYPWVLEQFRFHMSLTGAPRAGDEHAVRVLQDAATRLLAQMGSMPPALDGVVLFEQSSPDMPFRVRRRFAFGSRPGVPAVVQRTVT